MTMFELAVESKIRQLDVYTSWAATLTVNRKRRGFAVGIAGPWRLSLLVADGLENVEPGGSAGRNCRC